MSAAGALFAAFVLLGCGASPGVQPADEGYVVTAAEVFERMVKNMEARRAKEPWNKNRFAQNPYEMLDVKIEDWRATPEGRFAHSIRIPNPVPANSGYRAGMTQQEYFEHLCRSEAGEFIFKTVDNVDGIYQLRPRRIYSAGEWQHLYALEDPYGYWVGEAQDVAFDFVNPLLYAYFEIDASARRLYRHDLKGFFDDSLHTTPPRGSVIARYSGNSGASRRTMKLAYGAKAEARYAFTWRGVRRPFDRELGIAGGELIVLDRHTNEVLGVRRGYVVWNGQWTSRVCPRYGYLGGQDKGSYFSAWFIAKVVRPEGWRTFFSTLEKTRRVISR